MARVVLFLVGCLLAQAVSVPAGSRRPGNRYRPLRDSEDEAIEVNSVQGTDLQSTSSTSGYDVDDDDEFEDAMQPASSTGGGSNLISLINLASALFPSASGANLERMIRNMIREFFVRNPVILRRQDIADNVIEIDYVSELTPPFLRQESDNDDENHSNESDDSNADDDGSDSEENDKATEENVEENKTEDDKASKQESGSVDNDDGSDSKQNDKAAEESVEDNLTENDKASKQDSGSADDGDGNKDTNDSDYSDEPPGGGDGEGGGVLGLLAGLSGGEDGQSDLGSLLAAVSGIVGSLSGGEGFDMNSLIATAFGLFVGLLSEGEENPGTVIASYLLTSLDTITEGGFKNNGEFFGNFLSTLIKGTSVRPNLEESGNKHGLASFDDPSYYTVSDESTSAEENDKKTPMADSAGFFMSLLMSLSGDMSKGSSGGSSAWR